MTEWAFYIEPGPIGQQVKEAAFHAGNIRRALPKNRGLRLAEVEKLKTGGRRVVYIPVVKVLHAAANALPENKRVFLGTRPIKTTINQ